MQIRNASSAFLLVFFTLKLSTASAQFIDQNLWQEGFPVPENGRTNPYQLNNVDYAQFLNAGKIHAQIYPVTVTGVLPPLEPVKNIFDKEESNPLKDILQKIVKGISGIKSFNQVLTYMGMHDYPKESDTGVYSVPYPNGMRPDHPMGFGTIDRNGSTGFTISCAECHSSRLFGKTVLGLTNRFPRANHTFVQAKLLTENTNTSVIQKYTNATDGERELLLETKKNLRSVGVRDPIVLGLDTSLAQVALSLSRRNLDPYATKNRDFEKDPRKNLLDHFPADSKPAVWWNLKYKNRWLSDGSVVSGNPIFTNILWNEVGRGADLQRLEDWLSQNFKIIQEITTTVFSIEPPRITDFYSADLISLEKAKLGEKLFNQSCAKCHGVYEKAWSLSNSQFWTKEEQLKTIKVKYHTLTPVIDVGTDPNRYLGMKALEPLNNLQISKANETVIKTQKGYVPPPLVGIWARWPYFHNNSVPSLCAVLTKSAQRPSKYYAGNANNTETDFDFQCNGYPLGEKTPKDWKKSEYLYDTKKAGMKNSGHDEGIFIKNGQEIFTQDQKLAIVQFLQTL